MQDFCHLCRIPLAPCAGYLHTADMAYDEPLRKALEKAGGPSALARELKIGASAITQWSRLPAKWLPHVARLTGMDPEQLRPDLYAEAARLQPAPQLQATA